MFLGRFWVILQMVKCLHEHRLSHVSPVLWCSQYWPRIVNTTALFENSLKLVFQVRKKVQNGAKCPLQLIFTSHTIYTRLFAHKTEFTFVFWCTPRAHGYSASWLRELCWLTDVIMWYKSVWLESQKNSGKVRKACEISYRGAVDWTNGWL